MSAEMEMDFIPAEAFPPGEFLREEIAERGWTQADLADILGKSLPAVNEVIGGKREITAATAHALAAALGTSAQFWLNLESTYRLYLEAQKRTGLDAAVSRRAKLYTAAPVKEMIKRGWIYPSTNIDILEKNVCDFLGMKNLDEEPVWMPHAARKSTSYKSITPQFRAWLCRSRQVARVVPVTGAYKNDSVTKVIDKLKVLMRAPAETRNIARTLSDHGIRLVIVEPITRTKVDGATFWLDSKSPVVSLSLRHDRIDWLWHTLLHELDHVKNREGLDEPIVENLENNVSLPATEKRANAAAAAALVPPDEMNDFIDRIRPLYSTEKIVNFANRIQIHPGIVVGQLQFKEEIPYAHSRKTLMKVREFVVSTTVTDGWGFVPLSV